MSTRLPILLGALVAPWLATTDVASQTALPRPTGPIAVDPGVLRRIPVLRMVDLRPQIAAKGLTVRAQGYRGTCTMFATTFLMEYMQGFDSGGDHHASVEFTNWAANQAMGKADDGGYFEDVVAGYTQFGAVPEPMMPYKSSWSTAEVPSAAARDAGLSARRLQPEMIRANDGSWGVSDAQIATIRGYLDRGIPVAGGFRLSGDARTVQIGDVSVVDSLLPNASLYYHSVALVGYALAPGAGGGGYFIIRNSGGPNAGDHGYFYVSFDMVKQNVADVIVFKPAAGPVLAIHLPPRANAVRLPFAPINLVNATANLSRRAQ